LPQPESDRVLADVKSFRRPHGLRFSSRYARTVAASRRVVSYAAPNEPSSVATKLRACSKFVLGEDSTDADHYIDADERFRVATARQ
jgi:hypothetical protein